MKIIVTQLWQQMIETLDNNGCISHQILRISVKLWSNYFVIMEMWRGGTAVVYSQVKFQPRSTLSLTTWFVFCNRRGKTVHFITFYNKGAGTAQARVSAWANNKHRHDSPLFHYTPLKRNLCLLCNLRDPTFHHIYDISHFSYTQQCTEIDSV